MRYKIAPSLPPPEDQAINQNVYGMRSLLGEDMCQICGSTDGMHFVSVDSLAHYPPCVCDTFFALPAYQDGFFVVCGICNEHPLDYIPFPGDGLVPPAYLSISDERVVEYTALYWLLKLIALA